MSRRTKQTGSEPKSRPNNKPNKLPLRANSNEVIALSDYKGSEELIELGKLVGVWGVKGWVKVHSYTRERQGIGKYKQWILQPAGKGGSKQRVSVAIDICRVQGKGVVAKFVDLDDRDIAASLNGYKIFIEASQLPVLPKGQYYWHQLVGLSVQNTAGESFGEVVDMMETGANDVFVVVEHIEDENGDKQRVERLLPQIDDVVVNVDLDAQQLIVEWDKDFLQE